MPVKIFQTRLNPDIQKRAAAAFFLSNLNSTIEVLSCAGPTAGCGTGAKRTKG
jgi:hypothetical protein